MVNVHGARLKEGGTLVLADGEPYRSIDGRGEPRYDHAQVNHYCVKSREEYEAKVARGNATLPLGDPRKAISRPPTFFDEHDRNEERDTSILRRFDELRREMRRIEELL
jgi:hypothetical protein